MREDTSQSDDFCESSKYKKKGMLPEQQWVLEPHICRKCFGRLVSMAVGADIRLYRCTNCGSEAEHTDAAAVCCCGIKIRRPGRNGSKTPSLVDAGIRCIPNPDRSPSFPSEYVASEVVRK